MQCKYEYEQERDSCPREASPHSNSGLCILHENFTPSNLNKKRQKFHAQVKNGQSDFEECKLPLVDLSGQVINQELQMFNSTIRGTINLNGTTIEGDLILDTVTLEKVKSGNEGHIYLRDATVKGNLYFRNAIVEGHSHLRNITVEGYANFWKTTFNGNFDFREAFVEEDSVFKQTTFGRSSIFKKATVDGNANFIGATINGGMTCDNFDTPRLSFKDASFDLMWAQEAACRQAKVANDKTGNDELSDYHYRREMRARRDQLDGISKWPKKFTSYLASWVTGYGTKWRSLIYTWLLVITLFGLVYSFSGLLNNSPAGVLDAVQEGFYFSVITFTTLGYGDIAPQGAIGQTVASVESVFGGILMAAFVVVFARKYMR